MDEIADLRRKLRLTPGTALWIWPEDHPPSDALAADDSLRHATLSDADVAILFTENRAAVDAVLGEYLEQLTPVRAVWIIYAKANATDINRDTLWVQLDQYGWRAVSQVSFSDALSALRIRPLKPGERPRGL